jgi:hypothetical protein
LYIFPFTSVELRGLSLRKSVLLIYDNTGWSKRKKKMSKGRILISLIIPTDGKWLFTGLLSYRHGANGFSFENNSSCWSFYCFFFSFVCCVCVASSTSRQSFPITLATDLRAIRPSRSSSKVSRDTYPPQKNLLLFLKRKFFSSYPLEF